MQALGISECQYAGAMIAPADADNFLKGNRWFLVMFMALLRRPLDCYSAGERVAAIVVGHDDTVRVIGTRGCKCVNLPHGSCVYPMVVGMDGAWDHA